MNRNIKSIIKHLLLRVLPPKQYRLFLYQYHKLMGHLDIEMYFIEKFTNKRRTAIDVGANIGMYTVYLSKLYNTVYSFEPIPYFANELTALKLRNVYVYNIGLAQQNSKLELNIPYDNITGEPLYAWSYFEAEHIERSFLKKESIIVDCKTLDSYHFNDVDFIKIDVEGYELNVLIGAKDTINKYKPILLIEVPSGRKDRNNILNYLNNMGYSGYFIKNNKIKSLDEFDFKTEMFKEEHQASDCIVNFFFAHNSCDLRKYTFNHR
jgi:FkbM family methyltransferase